jgi:hypothetical protein
MATDGGLRRRLSTPGFAGMTTAVGVMANLVDIVANQKPQLH